MKKFICLTALLIFVCLSVCGCKPVETEESKDSVSMFVRVESATTWEVVYHRQTKVMYAVSGGTYNGGTFTLLVNSDGSPMVWTD